MRSVAYRRGAHARVRGVALPVGLTNRVTYLAGTAMDRP